MRHFLNGIEIAPRNLPDLGVKTDFTDRQNILGLSFDKIVLPREAKTIIENHVATQGVFEGIPYSIQMDSGVVLDYYVDLVDGTRYRDHDIEVTIYRRFAKDAFWEKAQGHSFELLAKKGVQWDFIDVPYLIIRDNQVATGITLALSLYSMSKELYEATFRVVESISEIIQAYTLNAGVPPSVDTGDIIVMWIKLAARIIYVALLLVACIKLAQQLFDLLFPKIRYYKAVKVKELISKSCQYFGYTFESTLLDALPGLTILPVPHLKQKKSIWDYIENDLNFAFTKGYPSGQDTVPTLATAIESIETMFNARTRVVNGVVRIERWDWWQYQTTNTILPALTDQNDRVDEYTLNAQDVWKRCYIHYQLDYSDTHTLDFFDYTDAEYSTEPTNPLNVDLVNIKGLYDVNIPYALGVRKTSLNWIERFAKSILQVIDTVTGLFGGGTNFAQIINNRIGVLQISQQFFSTTKLLYTTGNSGKQPNNYGDYLKASNLYVNYHAINAIQNHDYKIKTDARIRIRTEDFVTLLDNNFAEINGQICEILEMEYIDEKSFCKLTYRCPFDYANGKVYTLTINE